MSEVFPLSGHPKCFIPTGSANFFVTLIDDMLEDMFYPHKRESDPNKCFPTVLTANTFVREMGPKEAMELVDESSSKRYKKHTVDYFTETHNVNKIYEEYISLKPTCFLVMGEPSSKHYAAAKIFAENTNRVHLDVVDLVNLEMSRKSQCGKWIYSNLCEGRCIPISIVLHLIEAAVRQNIVQERGYVLSGFPIIPDQLFAINKLPKPLSGLPTMRTPPEHLVAEWLRDNKDKGVFLQQNFMSIPSEVKTVEMMDDFEGEDEISNLASYTRLSARATASFSKKLPDIKVTKSIAGELAKNLDDMFSLKMGSVDSEDIVNNDSYLIEIISSRNLKYKLREEDVQRSVRHQMNFLLHLDLVPDIIFFFRRKENNRNYDVLNPHNTSFEDSYTGKVFGRTLLFEVSHSADVHMECMKRQQERYRNCFHEIGKFVLHYFKESIIKVDTRFSAEEAAKQFQTGMSFINYKMVHIPEWINIDEDQKDAWEGLSPDDQLDALCGYRCLKPNLRWMKSQSGTLCPVKLFLGKMERGLIEYAVRYLGHVFLLSSYYAMTQFIADPNRYFFAKPNCRIVFISSEMRQSAGITAILQGLLEAPSFNWKDAVSQSPDSALMDIHEEARLWAARQLNRSKEGMAENLSTSYQAISKDYRKENVNAELTHIVSQNSNISVRERYGLKFLPAGPNDMFYQDTYHKLLEYKFYELYKERYAGEIAKQVIEWLAKQEQYKVPINIQQSYGQWIIQDAPVTLEFWQELEASGLLPDVVVFIADDWNTGNKPARIEFKHHEKHDIERFCNSMKASFPLLLKDRKHIQLEELVDENIGKLDLPADADSMPEPLLTTVGFLEGSKHEGLGSDEASIILHNYLTKRDIPLISTKKRGKKGALEILENYMGLYKSKPKKFNQEQLEEMAKISQESLQEAPLIPQKMFTDYNNLYKLDIGYLHKAATFEYNEQLRNYGRISNAEEVPSAEVATLDNHDNYHDIEALSEENIVSMKQKDLLRQFPFGNSGKYCPVELVNHKMLRLGNLSYTVEFGSRLYSMSSPWAFEEFLKCPFRFTFEEKKAPIPPYRICVLGPAGPNRIYFTKMLARKLNMKPQAYTKLLADFLQNEYPGNSAIFGTEDEVYDEYGRDFLQSVLKPLFKVGIILEGFPNNDSQFRDMLYHNMYPELVYIVDDTPDEALHYTFVQRHLRWEKQLQYKYRAYLQKLARLTKLSARKQNRENVVQQLRQQSDDIKVALSNIENRIRSTQENIFGEEDHLSRSVYLSRPGIENSTSDFYPTTYAVSQRSGDDIFSKKYGNIRKVLDTLDDDTSDQAIDEGEIEETEEEIDSHPESPLPTPLEKIMIKQSLMAEAKATLKIHLNELRNIIKACITSNIPVIKIPENCARKKCDVKLEVCSLKLRKFIYDQAIMVPPYTAEQCVKKGYSLYSHFKNFCPMDAYHLMPTNLHFTRKKRNELYAVIFRNLLYYINGSENLAKFSMNPRKFASRDSPFYLVLPMRILIIGPVSSGVTTLCARIASEFNMTHLCGSNFEKVLQRQYQQQNQIEASSDSNLDSASKMDQDLLVEYLHIHRNDSPNGIILDNYPITPEDLVKAAHANIAVHIVMIIKTEFWAVWRNWKTTYLQEDPPRCFSIPTQIALLHGTFQKYNRILKKYQIQEKELELFNIVYLKNTASKWSLWEEAKNEVLLCLREIGNYSKNIRNQQVVSISRMNVFRYEFEKRMSPVRLFCPSCLRNDGKLVKYRHDFQTVSQGFYTSACQEQFTQPFGYNLEDLYEYYNFPKPETMSDHIKPILSKNMFKINLVQYLDNFYWSCDQHHIDILLNGAALLPPDRLTYPSHIPFLVTNYLRNDVAHDGYCIVSYSERGITQGGDPNLAVYYRGKIHLCASPEIALQFLENPTHYFHMKMEISAPVTDDLDTRDMEIDYGPLTPELMIEALTALGTTRPKHFALNIADSAAIFVGLYLKTVNPTCSSAATKLNEEIYAKFVDECAYLQWLIRKYHQTKNPYIRS